MFLSSRCWVLYCINNSFMSYQVVVGKWFLFSWDALFTVNINLITTSPELPLGLFHHTVCGNCAFLISGVLLSLTHYTGLHFWTWHRPWEFYGSLSMSENNGLIPAMFYRVHVCVSSFQSACVFTCNMFTHLFVCSMQRLISTEEQAARLN